MNVIAPCKLGENCITLKGIKELSVINWFEWFDGTEFTYFYKTTAKWENTYFEAVKNPQYNIVYQISDELLKNDFLKDKGYPVKGKGYLYGIRLINNELYAEIIMTDQYYAHIYIQCNENGYFTENGKVYVPPSWDTEEKRKSILLSKYKNLEVYNI